LQVLPACTLQVPNMQWSAPLQKSPSSQTVPLGSTPVHVSPDSLHDSAQSPSPSGPRHGSPLWVTHAPPEQRSRPSQNRPSSQGLPSGSGDSQPSAVSLH